MRRSLTIATLSSLLIVGTVIPLYAENTNVPAAVTASPVQAEMSWDVMKKITLENTPIDTAIASAPDGSPLIFILTEKGAVQVYSANGELRGKVSVSQTANHIDVSRTGDMVFLSDGTSKSVEIINFDFPVKFDFSSTPIRGVANAPVTLTVFSDFQCPFCSKVGPLLEEVLKKYPKDVNLAFKHMPLISIHKSAMDAAKASMAAHQQGKFWEFHDKLFENQTNINDARFTEIAQQLNLDMAKFAKDKDDEKVKSAIARDMQDAASAAVNGTPTIFINGKRLKQRSIEEIQSAIDSELARLKKK